MNCRDIETLIASERDGELTKTQLTALSEHVAACPACHQLRIDLGVALDTLKTDVATVTVPDTDEAWHNLQNKLPSPSAKSPRKHPLAPIIWFSAPLAAAAAIVLVFFTNPAPTPQAEVPLATARADYVEAGDVNASTMVYVDKDSGWLVVWATNVDSKNNG